MTRRIFSRAALAATLSFVPVLASAQATDPPQYPLICRPGAGVNLSLSLTHLDDGVVPLGDNRGHGAHDLRPDGHMEFRRSDRAAGQRGENLAPGTCAWIDRPLLPSERNRVVWIDIPYTMHIPLRPEPGPPNPQIPTYSATPLDTVARGVTRITVTASAREWDTWVARQVVEMSQIEFEVWSSFLPVSPPLGARPPLSATTISSRSGSTLAPPSKSSNSSVLTAVAGDMEFRAGANGAFQIRAGKGDWREGGGVLTSAPSSAMLTSGQAFVAGRGEDNSILVTTCAQGSCAKWTSIGGIVTSGPNVRVDANGTVLVDAIGQNGETWRNRLDAATRAWSGWEQVQ